MRYCHFFDLIVEPADRILSEFPENLSIRAEQSLTRGGIEVLKSSPVTAVLPDGAIIGDRKIKSRTVLWTAGVTPSALAQSLEHLSIGAAGLL